MTILIVDDDAEIRLIAAALLERAGHTVIPAGSGPEALAACRRHRPDLVLMDLLLGEEDGVQVAMDLRTLAPAPPAVAFLSGAARADQVARMQAATPAAIIAKPFDPASFVDAVAACLAGAS